MNSTSLRLSVTRRIRSWSPSTKDLKAWICAALGRRAANREVSVQLVGITESRRLNALYRGRDAPTNVLSFPAPPLPAPPRLRARPLGDLVVCARVLHAEARAQGKTLRAHWAHLIVHGALHLAGYDHQGARDARRMERREIAVLRHFGFANPYRSV